MTDIDTRFDRFPPECGVHSWQPISFVFETEASDASGRLQVRQPDLERGRVYVVCMKCHRHSYIETKFVGFMLAKPADHEKPSPKIHYDCFRMPGGTAPCACLDGCGSCDSCGNWLGENANDRHYQTGADSCRCGGIWPCESAQ